MARVSAAPYDFAYDQLKTNIISGEFKPGRQLVITTLAKELGISTIPIREGLSRLSTEGLVSYNPHIGFSVAPMDYKELKENYIIRAELEGLATFYAVKHLTKRDFQMLRNNINLTRKLIEKQEFSKMGPLNKEFHQIIYKASPYKKLYKMIFALWDDIDRVQSVFALVPRGALASLQEHEKILRGLQKGDRYKSRLLVNKQKQRAWKELEYYLVRANLKKGERIEEAMPGYVGIQRGPIDIGRGSRKSVPRVGKGSRKGVIALEG